MILFKSISYKNILSVGNKPIVLDLNKHQRTLITGKNGQGKSLMADALCFALYGKAFRKIKKDQLVNSVNRKHLLVELEFSVGNVDYKIVRGIAPNKFEIYINGSLKNQDSSAKDYQMYLEQNILGMSEKTFRQIVILGSTSFVPFMKLTAADRRNVVENLLDIQIFSFMNQVLKGRLSTLSNTYRNVQEQLTLLDRSLELKKDHLDEVQAMTESKKQANASKIKEMQELIEERTEKIDSIRKGISDLSGDVQEKETIQGKISKLKAYENQITRNINSFTKEIAFFQDNDICPTCSQGIDSSVKNEHIEEKKKKISDSTSGLEQITESIKDFETHLSELIDKANTIVDLEKKIVALQNRNSSDEGIMKDLARENDKMDINIDIEEREKEISELSGQLFELKSQRDDLTSKGNHYAALMDLIKEGGIKTKIVKNYLPVINTLIKKYLSVLDFNVDFSFDETFSETIKARNRDIFSYANFSEGEKLRIDLCLLFTWREIAKIKNSAATNLILFDEIGSNSLDADGLDAFMRIISAEDGYNVYVISHNASMEDKFNNTLRIEKRGHFTSVIEA